MNEEIPQLKNYDEASLEAAFATLRDEVRNETAAGADAEAFRLRWLGRKQGRLKLVSDAWLKSAPANARKPLGMRFNQLKQEIEAALDAAASAPARKAAPGIDVTLPGAVHAPGVEHPLIKTMHEVVRVFHHLGYSTARDTQDTLLIAGQQSRPLRERLLMRTHTSPVQIRTMAAQEPPLRIVVPGKVHRNDAADATHSPVFHQVEGL